MRRNRREVKNEKVAPLLQRVFLMLLRSVINVAMVVLPLTCAQTAWGQGAISGVSVDSLETWTFRFVPIYSAKILGNVTSMEVGSEFSNTLETQNNLRLMSSIKLSKEEFRLQPRSNELKGITNTAFKQFGPGFVANLSQADSRLFNRIIKPGGVFQDLVVNTKSVSAGMSYTKVEPSRFRWDARVNGDVSDSEKSFKRDKTTGGAVGGGVAYTLVENRVSVRARGYLKAMKGKSESVLQTFDGTNQSQDSLSADVAVRFNDSLRVDFNYSDFTSEETLADQKQGSAGGQLTGAENVFLENKIVDSRTMGLKLDTRVLNGVGIKVEARHTEHTTDYEVNKTRFSRNVADVISGDISYRLFTGTGVTVSIENRESVRDLGPLSPRSYDEKNKQARLSINHRFSNTFSVDVSTSTRLAQSFYVRYDENPSDRDQLEQSYTVRINSTPFSKLSTSLSMSMMSSDVVNIDATLSENNRTTTKYDFRPALTYTLNDRVSVKQDYGLAIEFTEITFIPDDNYLDRNITFSNEVNARLSKKLNGSFYYAFHLHDRGSYLPEFEGGERFLFVDRKDRRDRTRIKFEYRINKHLRILGKHEYSRKKDTTVATGRERISTTGGIEGGINGSFNWGDNRSLSLSLVKANRYSPFDTDERNNNYWIMNAQFKYGF